MPRRSCMVLVVALWLVAVGTASRSSSGSFVVVENSSSEAWTQPTVDDTPNTTVFQPADDLTPKTNGGGNDGASQAVAAHPSDGNGGGLSTMVVAVIVSVSAAGLVLGVGMIVYAWRASRREEEAMFMDLGDERSYGYGQFGDYAAM